MTPPDPSSPPHLAPGAAALLDLSDDMRIRAIRTERFVGFARARRVLEILQALGDPPPSTRPPGLATFAHSEGGNCFARRCIEGRAPGRRANPAEPAARDRIASRAAFAERPASPAFERAFGAR